MVTSLSKLAAPGSQASKGRVHALSSIVETKLGWEFSKFDLPVNTEPSSGSERMRVKPPSILSYCDLSSHPQFCDIRESFVCENIYDQNI